MPDTSLDAQQQIDALKLRIDFQDWNSLASDFSCAGSLSAEDQLRFRELTKWLTVLADEQVPHIDSAPLIDFVGLDPGDLQSVKSRSALFDAAYLTWARLGAAMRRARKAPETGGGLTNQREPRKASQPGFGLTFDQNRREIRRAGFRHVLSMGSKTNWNVLRILDAKQGAYAALDDFSGVWEKCESDVPPLESLYKVISNLRESLEPIGLGVGNSPVSGWRLIKFTGELGTADSRPKARRK